MRKEICYLLLERAGLSSHRAYKNCLLLLKNGALQMISNEK